MKNPKSVVQCSVVPSCALFRLVCYCCVISLMYLEMEHCDVIWLQIMEQVQGTESSVKMRREDSQWEESAEKQ